MRVPRLIPRTVPRAVLRVLTTIQVIEPLGAVQEAVETVPADSSSFQQLPTRKVTIDVEGWEQVVEE